MKRLTPTSLAVALVALLLPTPGLAKGATEASIVGPGLDSAVKLYAAGPGLRLQRLTDASGFFPAVFARTPDPMLDEQPEGALGRRYTITYTMPGPNRTRYRIEQDLYPFAEPGPVTHVAPGQRYFGTRETRGGWFVAGAVLSRQLVAAGVPSEPPASADDDTFPWATTSGIAALAAALALALTVAVALLRRRRPTTA
jgi:hypothetical protein